MLTAFIQTIIMILSEIDISLRLFVFGGMTMYCEKCGAITTDGSRICARCYSMIQTANMQGNQNYANYQQNVGQQYQAYANMQGNQNYANYQQNAGQQYQAYANMQGNQNYANYQQNVGQQYPYYPNMQAQVNVQNSMNHALATDQFAQTSTMNTLGTEDTAYESGYQQVDQPGEFLPIKQFKKDYIRAWKVRRLQIIIINIIFAILGVFNYYMKGDYVYGIGVWFIGSWACAAIFSAFTKSGDKVGALGWYLINAILTGFIASFGDISIFLFFNFMFAMLKACVLVVVLFVVLIFEFFAFPFTTIFYFIKCHQMKSYIKKVKKYQNQF